MCTLLGVIKLIDVPVLIIVLILVMFMTWEDRKMTFSDNPDKEWGLWLSLKFNFLFGLVLLSAYVAAVWVLKFL